MFTWRFKKKSLFTAYVSVVITKLHRVNKVGSIQTHDIN